MTSEQKHRLQFHWSLAGIPIVLGLAAFNPMIIFIFLMYALFMTSMIMNWEWLFILLYPIAFAYIFLMVWIQ